MLVHGVNACGELTLQLIDADLRSIDAILRLIHGRDGCIMRRYCGVVPIESGIVLLFESGKASGDFICLRLKRIGVFLKLISLGIKIISFTGVCDNSRLLQATTAIPKFQRLRKSGYPASMPLR